MMFKADGRFVCWVCAENSGFKGAAEFALTEILGMPIGRIRQLIHGDKSEEVDASFFSISLWDFYVDEAPPTDLVEELKGLRFPLHFFPIDHKHSEKGREYLAGRGVNLDLAMHYRLAYSPPEKRVIIPNYIGDKLVGWQARYIAPTEVVLPDGTIRKIPKILTTGPRDSILMFQDNLTASRHAILAEGPFDGMKCHLLGGNVVTMGKVVSQRQLAIVKGSGVKDIYLGLDLDAGSESMELLRAFSDYADSDMTEYYRVFKLNPLPGYEDLGAMPLEAMPEAMARAELLPPVSLFLGLGA